MPRGCKRGASFDCIKIGVPTNPCPCGYFPLPRCKCSKTMIRQYMGHLSKPLMERIDICAEARPVPYSDLIRGRQGTGESSAVIRERVTKVHRIQEERFRDIRGVSFNSHMGIHEIERFCRLGKREEAFMEHLYQLRELSGRTYHKILKVARTIADMEASEQIRIPHLEEAAELRNSEETLYG